MNEQLLTLKYLPKPLRATMDATQRSTAFLLTMRHTNSPRVRSPVVSKAVQLKLPKLQTLTLTGRKPVHPKQSCDFIEKVAYEPFPSWRSNWPRTNHAPSLDCYLDRSPTFAVSPGD